MGQVNEISKEFKQWLFEEGRAGKTIESYVGDVVGFQRYLDEKAADSTQLLSRFSFVRYKQHLIDEHFAIATINKKINSLKVYNDFLVLKGLVKESCIHLRKDQVKIAAGSEQIVEVLTEGQVDTLLHFLEHQTNVTVRNKTICYLLLYGGLRISELVNIKRRDIDFMTSSLLVMGKGGKVREISIWQDVIELIQSYIKGERAQSDYVEVTISF